MNERIKKLAEQAGFHPALNWDHTDWHAAGHSNLFEKFAELIVRECAGVTLDYKNDDHYAGWCDHCAEILTHFGIEQ